LRLKRRLCVSFKYHKLYTTLLQIYQRFQIRWENEKNIYKLWDRAIFQKNDKIQDGGWLACMWLNLTIFFLHLKVSSTISWSQIYGPRIITANLGIAPRLILKILNFWFFFNKMAISLASCKLGNSSWYHFVRIGIFQMARC
jgi:hypothetical protein